MKTFFVRENDIIGRYSGAFFAIITLSFLIVLPAIAQVGNDDIENRLLLDTEVIYDSKTDHCTVQWDCVDESLTGKCIQYHNDQWYHFNAGSEPKLYLNIFDQHCRDLFGVQVVVLKGTPCQPETYQVLSCVSLETQNDIHIPLEDLVEGQNYLVNVDGYLEDFCQFKIQLSAEPIGLPVDQLQDVEVTSSQQGAMATMSWKLDQDLESPVREFQIYRRIQYSVKN
ncbi:hypothetical protein [Persicobacter diffluens]|uniref:Uncharacterized protein n=1 Tax=Persicobacter diffluens TaxID=981 RepID=A0AAN4W1B9_9BACT|nr:hypothetical protein PEDI_38290 [Persicobacter diffluens]